MQNNGGQQDSFDATESGRSRFFFALVTRIRICTDVHTVKNVLCDRIEFLCLTKRRQFKKF